MTKLSTRLRHSMNAFNLPPDDLVSGVSMTVPQQALSLRDLLNRQANGLPVSVSSRVPQFSPMEIPDLSSMDLVDQQEYRDRVQQQIRALKDHDAQLARDLAHKEQEAQQAELEATLRAKIEAEASAAKP